MGEEEGRERRRKEGRVKEDGRKEGELQGAIHKGRPHPRGKGFSQKRTLADAGERGVRGKKRTSSNFYLNFRTLNSVLGAWRQHLTQQLII